MEIYSTNTLMKRITLLVVGFLVLISTSTLFTRSTPSRPLTLVRSDSLAPLAPMAHHSRELAEVIRLLKKNHYHKVSIDDDMSAFILEEYIDQIDPGKLYFLQQDIDYFRRRYGKKLDDMLKDGNLQVPYQLYNLFREKSLERFPHVFKSLETEPDYSIDEYFESDYEKRSWARNRKALDARWHLRLKNEALNLKLANKDWTGSQELMKNRYLRFKKNILNRKSKDVFELFMNAFTNAFDPHTNYFSPVSSENFQISMSRSLEGIGARLQEELDNTVVFEVVPGGPAFKGGELRKDDKIIGVAQGDKGEFVDVIGWRLDEVVQLIRGPKGTVVQLRVIPAGALAPSDTKIIRIVRDKIKLDNALATHEIHTIARDGVPYTLGVIKVPDFYIDWKGAEAGEPNYRKCTRDVARLIDTLKQANVDALLIDLRNNGGGALSEAVEMSGLFIDQGPIVQVKDYKGNIYVNSDPDPVQRYGGPLAVLVNRFSASASEIFAAAIQDYQRGTVIGEPTYGKGTVQNLINLNKGSEGAGGQLKLTLAKYYRISGKSTQATGVEPDVYLPSSYDASEYREIALKSALPSDEIRQLPVRTTYYVSDALVQNLQDVYSVTSKENEQWSQFLQDVNSQREKRKATFVSLSYDKRKAEMEKDQEDTKEAKDDAWKKDPYLQQSLYLLHEMVLLHQNKP